MDSSDEDIWDEVEVPLPNVSETIDIPLVEPEPHTPLEQNIEVTLTRKGGVNKEQQEQTLAKRQAAAHDRLIRLESHKLHTVALLASLSIRNKWLNDEVLKARLMSLVPLPIQHGFTSIKKSAHPDPARRGRLFETALIRLVDWFAPSSTFAAQNTYVGRSDGWFRISNSGHIKTHTFEAASDRIRLLEKREVERKARQAKREERRAKRARARIKGKGKAREYSRSSSEDEDDLKVSDSEDEWYAPERLRSPNSIAKHALQRSGTRDMAALVFVGIVRALGIPVRLVSSLQCVSWSKPKDYAGQKTRGVKAGSHGDPSVADADLEMEEVAIPRVSSSRIGTPSSVGTRNLPTITTPLKGRSTDPNSDSSTRLKASTKRRRDPNANPGSTKRLKTNRQSDTSPTGEGNGRAKAMDVGNDTSYDSGHAQPPIKLRRARPTGNVLGAAPMDTTNDSSVGTAGPPTIWAEVFSRPDGRWIPVDPVRGIVNRAGVFEERDKAGRRKADKLMYVVAMEEDGYARDVTPRYAKNFGAHQARARARVAAGGKNGKAEWWESVMRVLKRPYALHRDDVEDAELSHQRAMEGLPTSVGAFKDHPIYALERHLRKDEAIHPRTEIAHFRGEPVFPRRNVLSLKPADGWMRQGRRLREGMQPIKMAKPRASTIRKKRELEMRREQEGEVMVGMYAEWQTEVYKPPPVVNGRIPTNDFGNVDLYVPSMLPDGAVHVPHKGCAKVARKLGIHFAEAVTGFEFRNRQATPIIKGIVIAAENEQVFLEALASHTHAEQLKEIAKRRERVLQRWTRLVQGLRIIQRVNEQYSHSGDHGTHIGEIVHQGGDEQTEPGGFLDDLTDVVRPYNLPEAQAIVPKQIDSDDTYDTRDSVPQAPLFNVSKSPEYDHLAHLMDTDENPDPEVTPNGAPNDVDIGPPLTMQQLADQANSARAKETSEQIESREPTTQNSETEPTQTDVSPKTDDIDAEDRTEDSRVNGAHDKSNVEATPNLRRSRRRNATPTAPDPPLTRTLRPRRRP